MVGQRAISHILAGFLALGTTAALAQEVPERRAVIFENVDFYGGDLDPVFDVTLAQCQSACLSDSACTAFTYNTNASACFPKARFEEMREFTGAISARIVETPEQTLSLIEERTADLDFLSGGHIKEAHELARSLGTEYPTNDRGPTALLGSARKAYRNSDMRGAAGYFAAALSLTDAPKSWIDLSLAYTGQEPVGWRERRDLQIRASAAAINGYLRAQSVTQQRQALNRLSETLEARNQGRLMIPVLRLSQELLPSKRTLDALDRAISNYGFRITDHSVDSNAVQPRICVNFSEKLDEGDVDFGSYIKLRGADLPVEGEAQQVCIDGIEHGKRYEFTVRGGLPAASGEVLNRATDFEVYVRDRNPAVRFTGSAYVLPKSAKAAIPVVTVNVDEISLLIHRVGPRNLRAASQRRLLENPLDSYEESEIAHDLGEPVWKGTGEVERRLNADITTALPIGDAITAFKPGVYVITARLNQDEDWIDAATQWFIVTDLGLTTLTGDDGLHVFARSLASAEAVEGADVQLIAANNEVLGKAKTDGSGYVRFAPGLTRGNGGMAPALLTIEGGGKDFAYLDLTTGSFDLSDRGVEGRAAPGAMDVYLTTERGAYRPRETVHATILARDAQAMAVTDVPLTAIVTRPDGVEHLRKVLKDEGAGGQALLMPLGAGVQRGSWSIAIYADPKLGALASMSFLVEDFTPERIDFDLDMPEGPVTLGDVPVLDLNAVYLYGAPGADLPIEGTVRLSEADGLEDFPDYDFGVHSERIDARVETLPGDLVTDAEGKASIPLPLPSMDDITKPLKMTAIIRVRDSSGRPVERDLTRPVSPTGPLVGIKKLFDGSVEEGSVARFEVIGVGEDGTRANFDGMLWEVSRVNRRYQWYEVDGNWRYEPITTRERVASGKVDVGSDKPAIIEASVDWGRHELKVVKTTGDYAASSVAFQSGWYAPVAGSDTPDTLEVSLDKEIYEIGDSAKLHVNARFPGKLLVTALDNRLIDMKAVDVEKGETVIDVPVTEDWGPGVYLTATLIRPMDVEAGRNPSRAIGVSYAPVDPGERRLKAQFTTPDEVDPRGPMLAAVQIDGLAAGETAYATIAAVDVGVLNVTGFEAPKPDKWYFGQRRLGMDIRDLYGRLIDGSLGTPGRMRSGGDGGSSSTPAPPPNEELVAYFSGVIEADAEGVVSTIFDMPDFNGTVKLMAIVWSDKGVGSVEKDVLVRDPIVVSVSTPRFLAPGDSSRVLVEFAHANGPAGEVLLDIETDSELTLGTALRSVALKEKGRESISIPISATSVGDPEVRFTTTTPSGEKLNKTVTLAVRANDPEISTRLFVNIAPGNSLTVDESTFEQFLGGTARATLAVGPLARFDVPGLLQSLDRYPYGCTEQTTSKAFPLLYFDEVASALDLKQSKKLDERIAVAVRKVMANQSNSGSFGLWYPSSGDLWLDAYVTDFLTQARAKGHDVPNSTIESALSNLKNRIAYAGEFESGGEDIAYALMVLAREGAASIGDLRYFADAKANALATPLAKAQLGAGLAFYGEQRRADQMFRLAAQNVQREENQRPFWRADYGTNLRDAAGVLALAVNAGSDAVDRESLTAIVAPEEDSLRLTSTQEKVWTLLAAHALIRDTAKGSVTVDGTPVDGPLVRLFEADAIGDRTVTVANTGDAKVDAVLTTFGVPIEPPVAGGNGYEITRDYYSLEGEEVTPDAVPQNTRLVAVLTVEGENVGQGRLIVDDPLPAGFEIDNPNLLRAGEIDALDWLDVRVTQTTEFRSDRFIAAVDSQSNETFQLAYIVRAVSPGTFYHPAASVEDMYRPEHRANTDAGRVEVLGAAR